MPKNISQRESWEALAIKLGVTVEELIANAKDSGVRTPKQSHIDKAPDDMRKRFTKLDSELKSMSFTAPGDKGETTLYKARIAFTQHTPPDNS